MPLLKRFQNEQPQNKQETIQPLQVGNDTGSHFTPDINKSTPEVVTPQITSRLDDGARNLSLGIADRILSDLPEGILFKKDLDTLSMIRDRFCAIYRSLGSDPSTLEGEEILRAVENEVAGYGPLDPLLEDDSISEVMVNGHNQIFVEKSGKILETGVSFLDDNHLMRVVKRITVPLGRHLSSKWPMVDGRLPDGSRVNIIAPPCALTGPTLTIRKFSRKPYGIDNLIQFGTLTAELADFLRACIVARLNIIISGGTGTGKTTFLNVLSSYIPDGERIVTIEDAAELQLNQRNIVTLEARPSDPDGSGRVAVRDLVINALRMRPDRIVVGECRGGEALDMLQAMNTGHEGSLTTVHSNTPRDCLTRIETMALMSGMELPLKTIRYQMASAIDLVIQLTRLRDGSRKVTYVTEVQGMEGDVIVMQDIFTLVQEGTDQEGNPRHRLTAKGIRPKFMPRFEAVGIQLPPSTFGY